MKKVLVTGSSGEMGQSLISKLSRKYKIIAIDIKKADLPKNVSFYQIDITNLKILERLFKTNSFEKIFHLAAILSTGAEKNPYKANLVNVLGMINLLELSHQQSQKLKKQILFFFPSSIAVYNSPKNNKKRLCENDFLSPITMYGINKLYCEQLGDYYAKHYKLLGNHKSFLDFRSIRFPGLISAHTTPSGGTSDYAPEMIHYAAKTKPYSCFVRPDTKIPFMAMEDAVNAIVKFSSTRRGRLSSFIYNISSFSVSAKDIKEIVKKNFPKAEITYKIDKNRQKIVDSWPEFIDDAKARNDWGWNPKYKNASQYFSYLVPLIKDRYKSGKKTQLSYD